MDAKYPTIALIVLRFYRWSWYLYILYNYI